MGTRPLIHIKTNSGIHPAETLKTTDAEQSHKLHSSRSWGARTPRARYTRQLTHRASKTGTGIAMERSVNERHAERASTDYQRKANTTDATQPWLHVRLPFSRHHVELSTWSWTSADAFQRQPRASRRSPTPARAIALLTIVERCWDLINCLMTLLPSPGVAAPVA